MINVIGEELQKIVDSIKAGNSNIDEERALELVGIVKSYTDKTQLLSKYEACRHLNISRATFDNYVREGYLPRGKKKPGFKELFWVEKELDECIKNKSNNN